MLHYDLLYSYYTKNFAECTLFYVGILSDFLILPQCIVHLFFLSPGFISKCIQLFETTVVRHGLMLVGPTGSGKTKVGQQITNTKISWFQKYPCDHVIKADVVSFSAMRSSRMPKHRWKEKCHLLELNLRQPWHMSWIPNPSPWVNFTESLICSHMNGRS